MLHAACWLDAKLCEQVTRGFSLCVETQPSCVVVIVLCLSCIIWYCSELAGASCHHASDASKTFVCMLFRAIKSQHFGSVHHDVAHQQLADA